MPEIGDKVQLTFPSNREEQAYVIYAVRNKQTHSTDDPQTKYLRTKDGKELRFGPKELVITGKDKSVYIQMTEDEGITINSNTNITLEAKGKILLAANENINLYAETGINMITNAGGSVRMDGTTRIFGRAIKDKRWTKEDLKKLKSTAVLAGVVVPGEVVVPTKETQVKKLSRSEKFKKIFGDGGYYKTEAEALKNMETITVNIWVYDEKTKTKVSDTKKLTVNKKVVNDVKAIFEEIYTDPEKFPIKKATTAGYNWRGDKSKSQHKYGLAIDINWDDNFMILNDGTIKAGKEWDPKNNIYSIPSTGSVVRAFKKYGWGWGGEWRSCKDYMHFSYLGL